MATQLAYQAVTGEAGKILPCELPLTGKDFGRGCGSGIPKDEVRISRKHCKVSVLSDRAQLQCMKRLWVRRGETELEHQAGDTLPLAIGDQFYLAKEDGKLKYGFEIVELPKEALIPSKPPVTPKKRKRTATADPSVPSTPTKKPNTGKNSSTQAAAVDKSGAPPVPNLPQFLSGVHVCFWEKAHMKRAMQLFQCAGGVIDASVGPQTQFIVAAKGISAQKVGEKLGLDPEKDVWPAGKFLVNQNFVSSCIQAQELLPPDNFLVYSGMRDVAKDATKKAWARSGSVNGQQSAESINGEEHEASTNFQQLSEIQEEVPQPNAEQAEAVITVNPPYKLDEFTGGASGFPWGTNDVWLEPWTLKSAQETLDKLIRQWHREAEPTKPDPDRQELDGSESSDKEDLSASLQSTSKCPHVACSKSPSCIISHLKTLSENYDRAGIDQFRRRAAENAMRKLKKHQKALVSRADVMEMALGNSTAEKVVEIVETGQLGRNLAVKADSKAQTILLFAKVWGAAHKTATRWYEDGCRTLEDVSKRTDLTTQQVAGLKHFDDLKEKMSPEEGHCMAEYVKAEVVSLFNWSVTGEDAAHVRQMGSYLRGKSKLSDVDMLLLPPASDPRTPSQLLKQLLEHLTKGSFLTSDMQPEVHDKGEEHSASFLGFCRMPSSPRARRIDIKIYPRVSLPFAVNYFTGSGPFNRALRFWANTAAPAEARAQQIAPQATGLKLSDTQMIARAKRGYGKNRVEEILGQSLTGITCETDIFTILGLSYVPPHLRMSGDLE